MARYYYHITENNRWKKEIVLKPRSPWLMDHREPDDPRICVAPTITGCISALNSANLESRMFVYRTKRKVQTHKPHRVPDAHITGERWILKPCRFVKTHVLDTSMMPDNAPAGNLREQRKTKRVIKNVLRRKNVLKKV